MRAGVLRNVITIQSKTPTGVSADYNEPTFTWSTWRTVFAEVVPRRGGEFFDPVTRQRFSQTVYRFRTRMIEVDGLTTDMRILFEGQYYDIRNAMPDLQRRDDCIIEATVQDGAA